MKQLILTRHAKSSWDSPDLADKDRPLNARGHEAAQKIGQWLAKQGYCPDQVLCSTAQRCRETWDDIRPALKGSPKAAYVDLLYLASDADMLEVLQTATGDTVMILGHMPGIGSFATDLRRDPPPLHGSFSKYPTAATTVLEFNVEDWGQARLGLGKFVDYVTPRDL